MAARFECEHCFKNFKSKESRHHHLANYHGYEPIIYKCEKCSKTFRYKHKLILHMSESHQQNDMRYECGQCTSSFKNYHHLRQHIGFVHDPNKKPYKCKECPKVFQRRDAYLQHLRYIHSKTLTLHRCELCNKIYKCKNTLKKHIFMNHDENFKRSACPICPSDFKWPHHLKAHINKVHIKANMHSASKSHTNRCSLCLVAFNDKFDMLVHMRSVHSLDVDIYKCCQCTAVFNLRGPFMRHLETHEESKGDHKCDQCYPILNPKLYVDNEHYNNCGLKPEDDIVDFEVTIMEDPDLRQLLRYKMRHADKNGTFYVPPDSNSQSDDDHMHENEIDVIPSEPIVELTIGTNIDENSSFDNNVGEIRMMETPTECDDTSTTSDKLLQPLSETLLSNQQYNQQNVPEMPLMASDNENFLGFNRNNVTELNTDTHVSESRQKTLHSKSPNNELPKSSKELIVHLKRIDAKQKSKKLARKILKEKKFKCRFCSETFNKPVDVARHVRLQHRKIKSSKINVTKLMPQANLSEPPNIDKNHSETSLNKISEDNPENAEATGVDKDDISELLLTFEESDDSVHKCGKCKLTFKSKLELLRHISAAHLNIKNVRSSKDTLKKSTKKSNTISSERIKQTDKEKLYECGVCMLNYNSEVDLTQHMKTQHRHKCGICNIAFVHKEKLLNHLENEHKNRPKEHKCAICSVVFKLATSLVKHMDEKHKDNSAKEPQIVTKDMEKCMHKCVHCGALFPLRESLQRHIQLEHDAGSVHKCGECTAVFNDIDEFKEHLLIEHMQN